MPTEPRELTEDHWRELDALVEKRKWSEVFAPKRTAGDESTFVRHIGHFWKRCELTEFVVRFDGVAAFRWHERWDHLKREEVADAD